MNPKSWTGARFLDEELGSEMIEAALTLPILLLVVFGILQTCVALYVTHFVTDAAREGARYAQVRGSKWAGTTCTTTTTQNCMAVSSNVVSYVTKLVPAGLTAANMTVTATWPGQTVDAEPCITVNAPGCLILVKITYLFNYAVPFVPAKNLTIVTQSEATVMQ